MQIITGIDPKALQLTIILLRQYRPALAKLLPGPKNYPIPGVDINLELEPEDISQIIDALNKIGEEWLQEQLKNPGMRERNRYRQSCLAYLLDEWIKTCEHCQQKIHM